MPERDQEVRRIIEDNVGKIDGDLIVLKNSINDVYRCKLTSGEKLIVKARLLCKEIVERDKKIMELLRYVSKSVKTCKYFGPGIIETDTLHVSLMEEVEGRYFEPEDILKKDCCIAIGKWIRDFHVATKKFENEFPVVFRQLPDSTETPHAHLVAKCRVPIYKKSPENYGLIHGDFHRENFFLSAHDNTHLVAFDFDNVSKDLYLVDLGNMIFSAFTVVNWESISNNKEEILQHKQNLCDWLIEGYSINNRNTNSNNNDIEVDRELLRQCVLRTADLTTVWFRLCLENGWRSSGVERMQKYVDDPDEGKHEFYDVFRLPQPH